MLDAAQLPEQLKRRGRSAPRSFRIAMVAACPFPAPRGTPIRIYRIAEMLALRGHTVDVFTYHLGERSTQQPFNVHRISRIPTYKKLDPGPSYQKLLIMDPLLTAKVTWGIKSRRYDIVHAHHFEGLLAALPGSSMFSTPIVFDVHTLLESELPAYELGLPKRWLSRIGRSLDRRLPPMSDHIIAVSEQIRERLLEHGAVSADRISLIPNGIESFFLSCRRPRPLASEGDATYLVYAGNLATYQGIELLLKAFADAHSTKPELRLLMLTDSGLSNYESLARELGIREYIDVANPGPEELVTILSEASVAANPRSTCSGLPQKLLNYMAAGCPIVSCEGSGAHIDNGTTGLLVENENVAAFSQAILRLLDDPVLARRLGGNAKAYVRENLSWEKTAECIEEVYDKLTRQLTGAHEDR